MIKQVEERFAQRETYIKEEPRNADFYNPEEQKHEEVPRYKDYSPVKHPRQYSPVVKLPDNSISPMKR